METITINEAIISHLIATGQLDETNPHIVRQYAEKATQVGVSFQDFYAAEYPVESSRTDDLVACILGL